MMVYSRCRGGERPHLLQCELVEVACLFATNKLPLVLLICGTKIYSRFSHDSSLPEKNEIGVSCAALIGSIHDQPPSAVLLLRRPAPSLPPPLADVRRLHSYQRCCLRCSAVATSRSKRRSPAPPLSMASQAARCVAAPPHQSLPTMLDVAIPPSTKSVLLLYTLLLL